MLALRTGALAAGWLLLSFATLAAVSQPSAGVLPPSTVALSTSISANITVGHVPLTVGFFSNVTGGTPPYTYDWNFADGCTCIYTQNATHTFLKVGTFMVRFTATDQTHASIRQWINITVSGASASGSRLLGLDAIDWVSLVLLVVASGVLVTLVLRRRLAR
ncbi:MAG: PKD domain-containing protein [Thermoplasmata archaeon]|nr:PKD domain-containing protein [Thermoplasmata archaeon]